jgi:hypothetical protein
MGDAIAALIGGALLTTFLLIIALKLQEVPVWIVFGVGLGLMVWSFWQDAFYPCFSNRDNGTDRPS